MRTRNPLISGVFLLSFLLAASISRADFPDRPAVQILDGNVQFFQVNLSGDGPGQTMKLRVYLPPGQHAASSLPCVFVAPAGSNFITGMAIGDGDQPEHLPYALAGFAVVGYELDGVKQGHTYAEELPAIKKFMAVHGGIDNAHTAVDYVVARVPEVDPNRLYAAGHSSAATVALDVTAADPRIKACCAYAPCSNLRNRFRPTTLAAIAKQIAEFDTFVDSASPTQHLQELKDKAVMLFTAEDDANIPTKTVQDFAAQLQQAGAQNIKLVTVATGGHFRSMIKQGIPAGIAFLKDVDAKAGHQ